VPLAVKIAPDLADEELSAIGRALVAQGVDAVIATNTTVSRRGVEGSAHAGEAGGLSGAPLFARSTELVRRLAAEFGPRLPVIAVGGIGSGADAVAKLAAGARLVQLYTGFIYRGPGLVNEVLDAMRDWQKSQKLAKNQAVSH
jgi:dihydroorotate dehydrogenase